MKKAEVEADPMGCCAKMDDFDTFWAFNDGKGKQRLGLNGVTTMVRKGMTVAADARPLQVGRSMVNIIHTFVNFDGFSMDFRRVYRQI